MLTKTDSSHSFKLSDLVSIHKSLHPRQCLFNFPERGSIAAADIPLTTLPEGDTRDYSYPFLNEQPFRKQTLLRSYR